MNLKKANFLILFLKISVGICNERGNQSANDKYRYFVKEKGIWCIKCDIGEYVVDHCTENLGYSTCKPCAENEYVSDGGATSCAACTVCSKENYKTKEYIQCTKSEDTVCICPEGQIFKDGYCQQCEENSIVSRTKSDVNGKCVKCESGKFYNNDTKTCSQCSSCAEDEDIVSVCEDSRDIQCKAKEDQLSVGEIVGIVLGIACSIIIVIIVFLVIRYIRKKRKQARSPNTDGNRPNWIEPLITILINELQDYASYFHRLDDLPNFNCRTRLSHLDNQHHREARQVIRNFVYEYHQAESKTVTPQTFATALEEEGLNATVVTMRADPILGPFLNDPTLNRQNPDAMPHRPNQSTSEQPRSLPNDNPVNMPLIHNQSTSQSSGFLPSDNDIETSDIPYMDDP